MRVPLSFAIDPEARLGPFLRLMGLPEDGVRFLRCDHRPEALSSPRDPDRRPLVVEVASGVGGWPATPCDNPWHEVGPRDVFLFGTGCLGVYPSEPSGRFPVTSGAERGSTPLRSEIRFSDDELWGPLRGLRAQWPVSPASLRAT